MNSQKVIFTIFCALPSSPLHPLPSPLPSPLPPLPSPFPPPPPSPLYSFPPLLPPPFLFSPSDSPLPSSMSQACWKQVGHTQNPQWRHTQWKLNNVVAHVSQSSRMPLTALFQTGMTVWIGVEGRRNSASCRQKMKEELKDSYI